MKVLVSGKGGKAGSWAVRGEQLGAAICADVIADAPSAAIRNADLIVTVKRCPTDLMQRIASSCKPWVLDFVDGWPQPIGNGWPREKSINWLRWRINSLRPNAIVFPTTRMLEDSGWDGPALVLPHHAWPKYRPQEFCAGQHSAKVRRVGYEGDPRYLGRWQAIIESECKRRGWEFIVNGDLAGCQIGVALRDTPGYAAGAWKANTKLANLQALGIAAVCSPECGYKEFRSGAEWWATEPQDIARALDHWTYGGSRSLARTAMLAAAPHLDQVAQVYRTWLHRLSF